MVVKTGTISTTGSNVELTVKTFITASQSIFCASSASKPVVKCITAGSYITSGESVTTRVFMQLKI
jgi:hypothetical protein